MKVSRDSQYVLMNHAPDVRCLFESLRLYTDLLDQGNISVGPKYTPTGAEVYWTTPGEACHPKLLWGHGGQFCREWERGYALSVLRCLINIDVFIQDGKVYVWHRDTGTLLETLAGHGDGSVNSAAWNPRNERMFATCSDDHTIRIWEAPIPQSHHNRNGKGKTRQISNGDSSEYESTFGTWIDG